MIRIEVDSQPKSVTVGWFGLRFGRTPAAESAFIKQDAVEDSRLRPRCRHLVNWMKHTRRL